MQIQINYAQSTEARRWFP